MVNPRGGNTHTLLTRRCLGGVIRIGVSHSSSIEKKIGKEFLYEDWLPCLHFRRFKTRFEICKNKCRQRIKCYSCDPKTFSGDNYFSETDELRDVSPQNGRWHTQKNVSHKEGVTHKRSTHTLYMERGYTHSAVVYGSSTRSIFCCKSWIGDGRQKVKKKIFTNNDADEAEEFTDLRKPRKVTCQILWISEQNAEYWIHLSATQERNLADSVYAIIMYQSMLKECVVQVVNKSEDEDYSQDNLCLKRTRSNTPKYLGSWRLRRLVQFLGSRDQYCKGETSTQCYQKVAIGRTRNYKDETRSTCRRLTQGQQSEWEGREEKLWSRQLRVA